MPDYKMHKSHRKGWLRAAVLGANDGIISTASLIIGVTAAHAAQPDILLAGVAGLASGAMSMAAGEYVSVSSQEDTENADLRLEEESLNKNYQYEVDELTTIYQERGLDKNLAKQVAQQLMEHDPLAAHARDELGIFEHTKAKPVQAAIFSAVSFFIGALLPLLVVCAVSLDNLIPMVACLSLAFLAILGGVSARIGGAPMTAAIMRVTVWGALAMLFTAMIGKIFNVLV